MTSDDGAAVRLLEGRLDPSPRVGRDLNCPRLRAREVETDRTREGNAVRAGPPGDVGSPCARDERLGGRAAGVDARPSEEVPFDDRDGPARRGKAEGEGRTRLPRSDDDRVKALHASTPTMRAAPAIATASSRNAAGRSRRKVFARLPLKPEPTRVPSIAPTMPAASPTAHDPSVITTAEPHRAPLAMRAPNCMGVFRLGVLGN